MSSSANTGPLSAPRITKVHVLQVSVGILLAAFVLAMWVYAPAFLSYRNMVNVLVQSSTLGILAIGLAVVFITGGMDLSMPANMALSAVLGGMLIEATGSVTLGSTAMVLIAAAIGAINGFAVAYLGMIPFVVTLATMSVASGIATWLSEGVSISQFPELMFSISAVRVLGIPLPVYILVALWLIGGRLLVYLPIGRQLYAVGISARAARIARVPVQKVLLSAYVIAGVMAGIAAILLTSRLGAASANMGTDSVVLDIMSACVVGGISIYGGSGKLGNAVAGAIIITLISNALNLLGASYFMGLVLKGAVIIAFIFFDPRSTSK